MNVYLYKLDEEYLKREEADILSVLPEWRISKYSKYTNEKAALLSLAAGALLVKAIREEGYVLPAFDIELGEYGKPYIPQLHFNLSHSGDYVAVCVNDSEIGIDIEDKGDKDQRVSKRTFCEPEKARIEQALKEQNGTDVDAVFRDIWTEKESYVKCTGDGISIPLNSFYVNQKEHRVYKKTDDEKDFVPTDYYVMTTRFDDDSYSLSVCTEKTQMSLDIVRVEVLV